MSDDRALRERIADDMQEASERAGCAGENQFDACVDVALRLVIEECERSERLGASLCELLMPYVLEGDNGAVGTLTRILAKSERAEAAERALVERGHAPNCRCHAYRDDCERHDHVTMFGGRRGWADPRCAPPEGKDGAR